MEFLVLSSRYVRKPGREMVVLQAVMEAAEALGAERVETRRGNVHSIGVYVKEGEEKTLEDLQPNSKFNASFTPSWKEG